MKKTVHFLIGLFLFSLYFAYHDSFTFPSSSPRWIAVFLFAAGLPLVFLISLPKRKITFSIPYSMILLLLFFLWNLFSGIWAIDKAGYIESNLYLSATLLFFFSFYFLVKDAISFPLIFRFLVFFLLLHCILGIIQYFGFDYFYQLAAPAGTFVNKNYATPLIPLLLPLLIYELYQTEKKKWLVYYSATFIILMIYLLIAATRSSWLSASLVFTIFFCFFLFSSSKKKIFRRFVPLFVVLFVLLAFDLNLKKSSEMHRDYREIESLVKPDRQLQERLDKWQNGIAMVWEKPLIGYGAGNFDANYPLFHDAKVTDTGYSARYFLGGIHNFFLQILIELGITGFLFLLIFWFRLLLLSVRKYRSSRNPYLLFILLGLFAFLADCFWNNTYQHPLYAIIIVIFASYLLKESDTKQNLSFSVAKPVLLSLQIVIFLLTIAICYRFVRSEIYMKKALTAESSGLPYTAWQNMNNAMEQWKWRSQNHYIASRIGYSYYLNNQSHSNWQLINQLNERTLQVLPYHYMPNFISLLLEMHLPNSDFSKKNIDLFLAVSPASKKGDSYEMIATVFEQNSDWQKALAFYEKALEWKPKAMYLANKIDILNAKMKDEDKK